MAIQSERMKLIGMRCSGCEHAIEEALRKTVGVIHAKANYNGAWLEVKFDTDRLKLSQLIVVIEEKGYRVGFDTVGKNQNTPVRKWFQKGIWTLLIFGALFAIVSYGKGLMPQVMAMMNTPGLGYGATLILGLLTGFHCIGMCGAFIVSYSSANQSSVWNRLGRHLLYGIGKTTSYAGIGAVFGAIGSILTITPTMRGAAAVISGIYLILFGLQMARIISIRWLYWAFPSTLMADVQGELKVNPHPLKVGLLTGFLLGCGPLQAMYVLAAGLGNPSQAAIILGLFSIGTLGPLIAFGFMANLLPRTLIDAILNASGILVLFMGLMMLNKGLFFTGSGFDVASLMGKLGHPIPQNEGALNGMLHHMH